MELKELCSAMLMQVRPKGVEVDAYPQVIEMLVNLIMLELTKGQ